MKLPLREVDSRSSTGKEQLLRVSQYTGVTQRKSDAGSDAPDTRTSSLAGYKRVESVECSDRFRQQKRSNDPAAAPFFDAGHFTRFHCRTASSSRSRALRSGR